MSYGRLAYLAEQQQRVAAITHSHAFARPARPRCCCTLHSAAQAGLPPARPIKTINKSIIPSFPATVWERAADMSATGSAHWHVKVSQPAEALSPTRGLDRARVVLVGRLISRARSVQSAVCSPRARRPSRCRAEPARTIGGHGHDVCSQCSQCSALQGPVAGEMLVEAPLHRCTARSCDVRPRRRRAP